MNQPTAEETKPSKRYLEASRKIDMVADAINGGEYSHLIKHSLKPLVLGELRRCEAEFQSAEHPLRERVEELEKAIQNLISDIDEFGVYQMAEDWGGDGEPALLNHIKELRQALKGEGK